MVKKRKRNKKKKLKIALRDDLPDLSHKVWRSPAGGGLQLTLLQNGENAFVRECGPLQTLLSSSLLMHCQDQPGSQTALQYPDTQIGKGSG